MNRTLYVGNLPTNFEQLDLEALFRNYGNIVSVKVFNYSGPEWLGKYGFVEMSTEKEAAHAIYDLSNYSITGKRITVAHIVPK